MFAAFASCNNFYKVSTAGSPVTANTIEELKMKNKYFILRDGTLSLAMRNMSVSADRKSIQCFLDTLPEAHTAYLLNGLDDRMTYTKTRTENGKEAAILNEVHLYLSPGNNATLGSYTFPISNIEKVEILEKDEKRTKRSHTRGSIAIVGAAVAVAGAVVLIIASQTLDINIH